MTSLELRKINNYPEWNTEAGINSVINFLQNQELPAGFNARQQRRFQEKFNNGNWMVENIENQLVLFYRPQIENEEPRINLVVSRPAERQEFLREIYNSLGYGKGINKFYNYVASKVLGINRMKTTDFLKKQGNYQITRPYQKIINSPILARYPNERWAADLIFLDKYDFEVRTIANQNNVLQPTGLNMSQNNRIFKYSLVVTDYFSKKVWAKPLKTKSSQNVQRAFNQICQQSDTRPHILQIDNGSEFKGAMQNYCRRNNIRLVTTTSYNPISNGAVERQNRELRKLIKAGLVKYNTLEWVKYLPQYLDNINSSKSSVTGFTPNELWTAGYNPVPNNELIHFALRPNDNSSKADIIKYVEAKLYRNAKNQLDRQRAPNQFFVNDKVRLKISALKNYQGTDYRKRIKDGKEVKYNAINYTTTIYKVASIIPPTYERGLQLRQNQNLPYVIRNQQYTLRKVTNNQIFGANGAYRFYGSDLLLIPSNNLIRNNERPLNQYPYLLSTEPTLDPNTMQRTEYINRFRNLPDGQLDEPPEP